MRTKLKNSTALPSYGAKDAMRVFLPEDRTVRIAITVQVLLQDALFSTGMKPEETTADHGFDDGIFLHELLFGDREPCPSGSIAKPR